MNRQGAKNAKEETLRLGEVLRFILDVQGVLITARLKASFLLCCIPAKQKIFTWRPWRLGGYHSSAPYEREPDELKIERKERMYEVGLRRELVSSHYMIGGEFGEENEPHAHRYTVEAVLQGGELNGHGFLTDIDELRSAVERIAERYEQLTLNDLPEFAGANPSLERFCRVWCGGLRRILDTRGVERITVRIWESGDAFAAYTERPACASAS
jgi:6-pyruvoyltetrahydropterin/6-carboxytetrahydropterin synthase